MKKRLYEYGSYIPVTEHTKAGMKTYLELYTPKFIDPLRVHQQTLTLNTRVVIHLSDTPEGIEEQKKDWALHLIDKQIGYLEAIKELIKNGS